MKLVNLALFRAQNGMTQDDLARVLRVTRPYISRIESGRARLSDAKIDELLFFDEQWSTAGLVPCFSRLDNLATYLHDNDESFIVRLGVHNSNDKYDRHLPFLGILSHETIQAIRHGKIAISEEIADKIVSAFPIVNRLWLISGEGEMLKDDTRLSLDLIRDELDEIKDEVLEMKKQIGELRDAINDLTLLMHSVHKT